jgi:hypothetical protein
VLNLELFCKDKGMVLNAKIFLGFLLQIDSCFLFEKIQFLVIIVENHRKLEKCKTNKHHLVRLRYVPSDFIMYL